LFEGDYNISDGAAFLARYPRVLRGKGGQLRGDLQLADLGISENAQRATVWLIELQESVDLAIGNWRQKRFVEFAQVVQ
jgi:hypothetical protein